MIGHSRSPPKPPSAAPHSFWLSVPHFCRQSEGKMKQPGQKGEVGLHAGSFHLTRDGFRMNGVSLLLRCPGAFEHSGELVCGPLKKRKHFPDSSRHGPHQLYRDRTESQKFEKNTFLCFCMLEGLQDHRVDIAHARLYLSVSSWAM